MTENFVKQKMKKLICSPMGCVRDKIPLKHFAAHIVKFQRSTGASIDIVSYDQQSYRDLFCGLTHNDFVNQLHDLISAEQNLKPAESSLVRTGSPEKQSVSYMFAEEMDCPTPVGKSLTSFTSPYNRDIIPTLGFLPWCGLQEETTTSQGTLRQIRTIISS